MADHTAIKVRDLTAETTEKIINDNNLERNRSMTSLRRKPTTSSKFSGLFKNLSSQNFHLLNASAQPANPLSLKILASLKHPQNAKLKKYSEQVNQILANVEVGQNMRSSDIED